VVGHASDLAGRRVVARLNTLIADLIKLSVKVYAALLRRDIVDTLDAEIEDNWKGEVLDLDLLYLNSVLIKDRLLLEANAYCAAKKLSVAGLKRWVFDCENIHLASASLAHVY
jgi:hypothetical protein